MFRTDAVRMLETNNVVVESPQKFFRYLMIEKRYCVGYSCLTLRS